MADVLEAVRMMVTPKGFLGRSLVWRLQTATEWEGAFSKHTASSLSALEQTPFTQRSFADGGSKI